MSDHNNYPEVAPSRKPVFYDNSAEQTYTAVPSSSSPVGHSATRKRGVCGLTTGVFAIIVGLVVLLIGAAIGGGVGGSVAVNQCNSKLDALRGSVSAGSTSPGTATTSSSTSTSSLSPNSSSSSTFIDYTLPVPQTLCGTASFTSNYTTESSQSFTKSCAHEVIGSDIDASVALTWELCMEACGRYNAYRNGSDPTVCMGVTYVPSWVDEESARTNISFWSNCFLKYEIPDLNTIKNAKRWEVVVSLLQV